MASLVATATNTAEVGINAATYAGAHDAATGGYANPGGAAVASYWRTVDSKYYVQRGFLQFDTSSLGGSATITAATLRVFGNGEAVGGQARSYNIYGSTAANNPITTADFDQVGNTAFADSGIADTSWDAAGWNTWTLNATGLAAISKTGTSYFSIREVNYDVANTAPTVKANVYVAWTNTTAAELTITYTTPTAKNNGISLGFGVGLTHRQY